MPATVDEKGGGSFRFSERQHVQVGSTLEKLRANTDWIETAVATGRTDLDEALAQLLRGQERCLGGECPPISTARRYARR